MARQQFNEFTAAELYCPHCHTCQPVRPRPADNVVQLLCTRCATVLGHHTTVDHSLTGKLTRLLGKLVKK